MKHPALSLKILRSLNPNVNTILRFEFPFEATG